jgi:putative two-component system response regulator
VLSVDPAADTTLFSPLEVSPTGRVLVVDDTREMLLLLSRILERDGHTVDSTADADEALRLVAEGQHDLVLLDVLMPQRDGFEVCRAIKARPETMLVPVVLVTGLQDMASRLKGIEAGADDFLTKPVNVQELRARARSLVRLKHRMDDLESAESVILSLALTIEARDATTEGHCQRLAAMAVGLGRALGLLAADLAALQRGGYLHDVGKVGVPDAILLKRVRLDDAEMAVMRTHTLIGERLCGSLRSLRQVRSIVRSHHERLDGSGYPDGLSGDAVPLLAQILGIVDVYDALVHERPYKPAFTPEAAVDELRKEVGRGWRSGRLVEVFVDELRRMRVVIDR